MRQWRGHIKFRGFGPQRIYQSLPKIINSAFSGFIMQNMIKKHSHTRGPSGDTGM